MDTAREHKADLGNHKALIANYIDPLGWEIGVYPYPHTSNFAATPGTPVVDDSSAIKNLSLQLTFRTRFAG
jgi:hypothetical protein